MEVARLTKLSDLRPLILGNFIHLALFSCLVWVLGADGEEEVLSAVLESLVQVGQLMTRTPVVHRCLSLRLISLFIDDEAVIGDNRANFIFFLFTSDAEYLVVDLNGDEFFGKDLGVAEGDRRRGLGGKIMDHQLVVR